MDAQLCLSARSASDIIHRMSSSVDSDRERLRARLPVAPDMMAKMYCIHAAMRPVGQQPVNARLMPRSLCACKE